MRKIRLAAVPLALSALVFLLANVVFAHGLVDQTNLVPDTGTAYQILAFSPIGQEFVPSNPLLVAVDVDVGTFVGGATLTANIRSGTIGSSVLASKSVAVPDHFSGVVHFDLPAPLAVIAGDIYVLELVATNPSLFWKESGTYAGGRAIRSGSPITNDDWEFQTYGEENQPPDCSNGVPSQTDIWPPNHEFVPINLFGVTDPNGDAASIIIDGIWQDEPVNGKGDGTTSPDGQGVGTEIAEVRAERSGNGDGRVYRIAYTADDGNGGTCTGEVEVRVPHDKKDTAVNSGTTYDSTMP